MDNTSEKLVIISDTHAESLHDLPLEIQNAVKTADYIIHLGDFTSPELVKELQQCGKFFGVAGNHDNTEVRNIVQEMEVISVRGKKIGMIHGMYFPFGAQRRMKDWFKQDNIDVLLYGHIHSPVKKRRGKILYFNPGTASGQFPATKPSFGILTIDGTVKSEIIRLDYKVPWGGLVHHTRGLFLRIAIAWIQSWPIDFVKPVRTMNRFFHSLRHTLRPRAHSGLPAYDESEETAEQEKASR